MYSLNDAYNQIKKKIIDSKDYANYVYYITSDPIISKKFNESTSYEKDGKTVSFASEVVENIDFINEFSKVYGLDSVFCDTILKAFGDDNIIDKVINTKFTETLYGNPSKEDLNSIDALFTILESVFGLDTIIKSFNDKTILDRRFKEVTGVLDDSLEYDFLSLINKIYNETCTLNSYDYIKKVIKSYKDELNSYILPGLVKQIDEETKSGSDSIKTDNLSGRIIELVGDYNKKM